MPEQKTNIYDDLEKEVVGYMLNTGLSEQGQNTVTILQENLVQNFPGIIWVPPKQALHITLMDWVAPLVEYNRDKDELFQELFSKYDKILSDILKEYSLITIDFQEILVSPGAIAIKGKDKGQFQEIRDKFLHKAGLVPGTKPPPKIIHSTVARFLKEYSLNEIEEFIKQQNVELKEHVSSFRLVQETKIPMLEFNTIKEYKV